MLEILFWILVAGLMVFACWVAWYLPRIRTRHLLQVKNMTNKLQEVTAKNLLLERDLQQMAAEKRTLHQQLLALQSKPGNQ